MIGLLIQLIKFEKLNIGSKFPLKNMGLSSNPISMIKILITQ